jgi:hypothetical protein
VLRQGTLILTGGLYEGLTLDLDEEATVIIRGATEIRIKGELDTGSRARIIGVLPASMHESGGRPSYGHEQEDGSCCDRDRMRRQAVWSG